MGRRPKSFTYGDDDRDRETYENKIINIGEVDDDSIDPDLEDDREFGESEEEYEADVEDE